MKHSFLRELITVTPKNCQSLIQIRDNPAETLDIKMHSTYSFILIDNIDSSSFIFVIWSTMKWSSDCDIVQTIPICI